MIFSKKIYLSPDIKQDYRKYMRMLKFNKSSFLLHLVVFLEGEETHALIVGLALGKKSGIELISNIVEDTYRTRKDFEYYSFFKMEEV